MASIPIAGTVMPDGKVVLSDLPEDDRFVPAQTASERLYAVGTDLDRAAVCVGLLIADAPSRAHGELSWLTAELKLDALRCYAASELVKDG